MPSARPRTLAATLAVMALVAALAAFFATAHTARADESVSIPGMSFSPASVTVAVGDTVTWTNNDGEMPHTVTSTDGGPLDSDTLNDGDEYAFTFTEAGTYEYACAIHPTMTGSVTVEGAANGDDSAAADDSATADDNGEEAAPPATGTGTASSGSGVPWMLIVAGVFVVALAAGLFGIRALRNS